ncbi:MAG TPA: L,D-transpeptidase [Gallionella sp.]
MALFFLFLFTAAPVSSQPDDGAALAENFKREVDRRLAVPQQDQARYAQLLESALADAGLLFLPSQYLLLVDRSPLVQVVFIYWLDAQSPRGRRMYFIGASPTSTGRPGRFDYFTTPLAVFPHTLENLDYRAEGTYNGLGNIALGRKGMRVYDFGWTEGERGWGRGGKGQMRLLLHATDPDHLEPYLGTPMSKGCIRIPATLNSFIDRYGLLDADYEQAMRKGKKFWVLRHDRTPTRWSGRYMAIVDSESLVRPPWSPDPLADDEPPGLPPCLLCSLPLNPAGGDPVVADFAAHPSSDSAE